MLADIRNWGINKEETKTGVVLSSRANTFYHSLMREFEMNEEHLPVSYSYKFS